jgi:hypothetical protein
VKPGRWDPIQGGGAQHVRHPVVEHPAVLPQETHGRQEVHVASGFSKTCSNSKTTLGRTRSIVLIYIYVSEFNQKTEFGTNKKIFSPPQTKKIFSPRVLVIFIFFYLKKITIAEIEGNITH